MKTYKLKINGQPYEAKIVRYDSHSAVVNVNGVDFAIDIEGDDAPAAPKLVRSEKMPASVELTTPKITQARTGELLAPIPGLVVNMLVKVGDMVTAGQPVLVLEAMKMESEIPAPCAGKIKTTLKNKGDSVQEGDLLLVIESV
jgi:glutaconyl-CoA/methylmalonyl-CoA decarboxylase subunit gamma